MLPFEPCAGCSLVNIMSKVVNIALLGRGNVGKQWLALFPQIKSSLARLAQVKLVLIANSTKSLYQEEGCSLQDIEQFEQRAKPTEFGDLIDNLSQQHGSQLLVLDLTASAKVANAYFTFAEIGWNIISANKLPLTFSRERQSYLNHLLKHNNCFWGINATVGAALPVQSSLSELLQSGDRLYELSGVFSGSLSYLLGKYDGSSSFMELILSAKEQGITEPDPRDDLSGADVARKLLILSRIAGYKLDINDIDVSPLLPEALMEGSLQEFLSRGEQIDQFMNEQFALAVKDGKKLVYKAQATFVDSIVEAKVGLVSELPSSANAQLTPLDNVFVLKTDFYSQNPLVVRGPGAGTKITATAVNIDLNTYVTKVALSNNEL